MNVSTITGIIEGIHSLTLPEAPVIMWLVLGIVQQSLGMIQENVERRSPF